MADLAVCIALVLAASIGIAVATLRLLHDASRARCVAVAMAALAMLLIYAVVDQEPAWLTRVLPFAGLTVLSNWTPLAAGLLAGGAWRGSQIPRWRKTAMVASLAGATLYMAYGRLFLPMPTGRDEWSRGVALQSSDSTCGAACAATLLNLHDIHASEAEMIELCLTRTSGSTFYGIYRGLKKKTAGTGWDVEAFQAHPEDLREASAGPCILLVGLPAVGARDPRYAREWGWIPGVQHAVVFFRFREQDRIEVGDPAIGREHWHKEALDDLWPGKGLRLVRK